MYQRYFGLAEAPFSIAPDPRYLYLSQRHQEALAHLLYGVDSGGGFVLLTGEVGAGKTTVCRCLLEQIPETCDVAYIFNPQLTVGELLATICTEFGIGIPPNTTRAKVFIDGINTYLLDAHAKGRHTVLIIDEAQSLSIAVLEQMRLLTNLETNQRKLLQIILLGQPELATMLARPELRALSQRIVARYHLGPLSKAEIASYVQHRLEISGTQRILFPSNLMDLLYRLSGGVPRVINVLCDRALLGAYVQGKEKVNRATLKQAAREVLYQGTETRRSMVRPLFAVLTLVAVAAIAVTVARLNLWQTNTEKLPLAIAKPAAQALPQTTSNPLPAKAASPAKSAAALPTTLQWPAEEPRDNSKALAYVALFKAWGLTYQAGGQCRQAETLGLGLYCQSARGGLADLQQRNRPAVLQMQDDQGREYFATLTALDSTSATFTIGSTTKKVALGALANQWSGYYTLLWRLPADTPRNILKGQRGPATQWLRKQLAQVQGKTNTSGNDNNAVFDDAMEQQVKQFQLAQGLVPDGAIGPKTLVRLSSEADQTAPRLFPAPRVR
jgi:general secretion pathway protein A